MKWWMKALIGSLIWSLLIVAGVMVMTQRIRREARTPAHREAWDRQMSQTAGILFVFGQFAVWGGCWSRRR
jgi:hypothetical protein